MIVSRKEQFLLFVTKKEDKEGMMMNLAFCIPFVIVVADFLCIFDNNNCKVTKKGDFYER